MIVLFWALSAVSSPPPVNAMSGSPPPCSVIPLRNNPEGYFWPLDSVRQFVWRSTLIVRAVAQEEAPWQPTGDFGGRGNEGVRLRIVEVIHGSTRDSTIVLPGSLTSADDFNRGAVPYRMVRPDGQRGDCYARRYRRDGEYLLLLQPSRGGWTPHWAPLAPMNEQLRGPDDAWLGWVRTVVGTGTRLPNGACYRFDRQYFEVTDYPGGRRYSTAVARLDTAALQADGLFKRLVPCDGVDSVQARSRIWTRLPYWRTLGDSIHVSWHTGLHGPLLTLAVRGDSLVGRVLFSTDVVQVDSLGRRVPVPSFPASAVLVPCPQSR